jgi:hypothetical protein
LRKMPCPHEDLRVGHRGATNTATTAIQRLARPLSTSIQRRRLRRARCDSMRLSEQVDGLHFARFHRRGCPPNNPIERAKGALRRGHLAWAPTRVVPRRTSSDSQPNWRFLCIGVIGPAQRSGAGGRPFTAPLLSFKRSGRWTVQQQRLATQAVRLQKSNLLGTSESKPAENAPAGAWGFGIEDPLASDRWLLGTHARSSEWV